MDAARASAASSDCSSDGADDVEREDADKPAEEAAEGAKREFTERVVVIGGGWTGCLAAIQLARAGYAVTVVESRARLMDGASKVPARLHLGGEYPLDKTLETGKNCLHAALVFRQIMPEWVFTRMPPCTFIVAQGTQDEGELTVESYVAYYTAIREEYARYCDLNPANMLFGPPDAFFRVLEKSELVRLGCVAGGVTTQELGMNPVRVGAAIECKLKQLGVEVVTSAKVVRVVRRGVKPEGVVVGADGRKLSARATFDVVVAETRADGGSAERVIAADQLLNSSWDGALHVEHTAMVHAEGAWEKTAEASRAKEESGVARVDCHLRGMALLDISRVPRPIPAPVFMMKGEYGGMWNPFNEHYAYLYLPSRRSAYIDSASLAKPLGQSSSSAPQPTEIPEPWLEVQRMGPADKQARLDAQMRDQVALYPFLKDAVAVDLVVRTIVNQNHNFVFKAVVTKAQQTADRLWTSALSSEASALSETSKSAVKRSSNDLATNKWRVSARMARTRKRESITARSRANTGVTALGPGFFTATPGKGTYTPLISLQVLASVQSQSYAWNNLSDKECLIATANVAVPVDPKFRLYHDAAEVADVSTPGVWNPGPPHVHDEDAFLLRARKFAVARGWPENFAVR